MTSTTVSLRSRRDALLERADLQGMAFCQEYAATTDAWLSGLFEQAAGGKTGGLALIAVGGYGRGELFPYSDLDVVLVHRGRRDVRTVADAVWYPVWDEGIRLDHAVRRPGDVLEMARKDLRVQLGLLDGRLIAGDAEIARSLLARALNLWRAESRRWLPVLADSITQRHQANGDVAFLLEPELKEGRGGLRDVNALRAVALALPDLEDLVDVPALSRSAEVLTEARVELHRQAGRALDRLLLQEQDQVAAALGYDDADVLMAAVASAGRTVAWVDDQVWRRRWQWEDNGHRHRLLAGRATKQKGLRSSSKTTAMRVIEPGIAVPVGPPTRPHEGEIVLDGTVDPTADVTIALRLAAVAAERDLPISRSALDALAANPWTVANPWPPGAKDALVRVLAAGKPAVEALEALDQHDLLERFLPEWRNVRNRPQRNAYHRFTVDRHLLEAATNAARLVHHVSRPDLLLLATLLHDIGKGFPGDHTAAGIVIVDEIVKRMGLSPEDGDTVVALVRYHLLLSELATRRDLDDPATVQAVVQAVGDRPTLELLAALTEADSLATGPAAWGPWKAGLVAELVRRAGNILAGESAPALPPSRITDDHRALMDQVRREGRPAVVADVPHVTVVALDQPGLLATVTGVFALSGLDIRSADVAGDDGMAVEVFVVDPSRGRWPDWKKVADELQASISGQLSLGDRLRDRARLYAKSRRATSSRPASIRVTVDNGASATSTVVEVQALDQVGLLHQITRTLFELGLDVVAARVATLGHEVVDAFYVREKVGGGKVSEPERVRALEHALHEVTVEASDRT